MIVVERLSKSFAGTRVLDDVHHRQARGQTAVLIGPSGCGKTTFLRCLNQLETPDTGRIVLDDVVYEAGRTPAAEAQRTLRRRAGMVFQQFHLFPHRTALENVMEGPRFVLGQSRADAESLAHQLLARVGLAARAHHYPSQLSGGQQQRVAIARALALSPSVLLLDEPTSALDPGLRAEVGQLLRQLADDGLTLLVVTHDLQLARDAADLVLFFHAGRIAESGPPTSLLQRPQTEALQAFLRAAGVGPTP